MPKTEEDLDRRICDAPSIPGSDHRIDALHRLLQFIKVHAVRVHAADHTYRGAAVKGRPQGLHSISLRHFVPCHVELVLGHFFDKVKAATRPRCVRRGGRNSTARGACEACRPYGGVCVGEGEGIIRALPGYVEVDRLSIIQPSPIPFLGLRRPRPRFLFRPPRRLCSCPRVVHRIDQEIISQDMTCRNIFREFIE